MTRRSRTELRGKAQTVLGPIDPASLGPTLMHEHVLWDICPPSLAAQNDPGPQITLENVWAMNYGTLVAPGNLRLGIEDLAVAIDEIGRMRDAGGRTVVELSCGGLKPDPRGLVQIAEGTGVNIVMGCGHYVEEYQDPANRHRSVDSFAAEMVDQVQVGAWGTPVRAGMIGEIGCQAPWTELEKRVMQGAILAQRETGAAINVHPGRHPDQPLEVADFVRMNGGAIDRVVISHIDRTIFDEERLLRLADSGCVVEFDLFGQEQSYYKLSDIDMPNDAIRLRLIRALIDRGHVERIVISHDICYRSRLSCFGGHGYGHIFSNVVPMMRRRGFSESEIEAILVTNPRRLLTFI
ncbi:MAG: aryldialkylphosphatase [Alphaproteobacteria bacterium]|nr:aryldialkylphosphatase [Alphaproteobacteria bacterium]